MEEAMSPFMQLPPELRNRIYELVLGGNMIRVAKDLQARICFRYCSERRSHRGDYSWTTVVCERKVDLTDLALPRTCRALYSETSGLFFSSNVFDFFALHRFQAFERTLSPSQKASVRHLHFQPRFFGDVLSGGACSELSFQFTNMLNSLPGVRLLLVTGGVGLLDPFGIDPDITFRDWQVNILCLQVSNLEEVNIDLSPRLFIFHDIAVPEQDSLMKEYSKRLRKRLLKLK